MIYHTNSRFWGTKSGKYDSGNSYVASGVITTTPTILRSATGYNSGPQQWLMFYNSATVPADGQGCQKIYLIPATSSFAIDTQQAAEDSYFYNGLTWSNSTTSPTKTLGAANVVLKLGYEW